MLQVQALAMPSPLEVLLKVLEWEVQFLKVAIHLAQELETLILWVDLPLVQELEMLYLKEIILLELE
jgi:hypothetical protein